MKSRLPPFVKLNHADMVAYEPGWLLPPTSNDASVADASPRASDNELGRMQSVDASQQRKHSLNILSEVALASSVASILFSRTSSSAGKARKSDAQQAHAPTESPPHESDSDGSSSDVEADAALREKRKQARIERWVSGGNMKLTREFRDLDQGE